jgi:hypothetical protein
MAAGQDTPALRQEELRNATVGDMRREGVPDCTSSLSDASKDNCQLTSLTEQGSDSLPANIRQEPDPHSAEHHSAD